MWFGSLSANFKERLFCAIAYVPKATVQAAIGAIPLAAGLECGQTILTCAVLAILVTAPLGAIATDFLYKKLLGREKADRFATLSVDLFVSFLYNVTKIM